MRCEIGLRIFGAWVVASLVMWGCKGSDDRNRNNISDAAYYVANDGADELPVSMSPNEFSIINSSKTVVFMYCEIS